jgi:Tfp pilus assembly protein PilF
MDANSPSATLDLAEQHFAAGRLSEAEPLFRRVLGVSGDDVRVLHVLGHIARQQGRAAASVECYAAAVALDPDNAQLHNNLAEAQQALGQHEAAIASYRRASMLAPDEPAIHFNLGALLHALHRMHEAAESLECSIALRPDVILTRSELCPVLCSLGRYEDALVHYRAALAIEPENWTARYLEALAMLALGDFTAGWEAHEVRWRSQLGAERRRLFPQPYWLGEDIAPGQTILLHAEQGLGDTLQFVRYAPLVAARGARVLLEVQPTLVPLLKNLPGIAGLYARGDALPPFDLQSSMMSMPRAFRTTVATVPASVPYLTPPPERVALWRERLGPPQGHRIGIAWSGTPEPWNRAMPLALLAPLTERTGCELHVLQTELLPQDCATLDKLPHVRDHSGTLTDFADTAAIISLMDLVISIDTATAHLAGAMGKPTWTMLPLGPDYRWMLQRTDSPWYPTMRLFRQPALHDWPSVVADIIRALDTWR